MTGLAVRTREAIEADITSKRRERELYVSAEGVRKCHAAIDVLLEEWESAALESADGQPR